MRQKENMKLAARILKKNTPLPSINEHWKFSELIRNVLEQAA